MHQAILASFVSSWVSQISIRPFIDQSERVGGGEGGATQQSFIRGGSLDIWVRYHFSLADTLACSTSLSFFLVYWPFRPLPCFYNCRHCCFGLLFDLHYMAYFLLTTSPCVCFLISSTTLLDILETKKNRKTDLKHVVQNIFKVEAQEKCLKSVFTWLHGGHIGVPKQWNGGHVSLPRQSYGR